MESYILYGNSHFILLDGVSVLLIDVVGLCNDGRPVGTSLEDCLKVMTFSAKSVLLILSSAFTIVSYVAMDPHLCFQHSSILIFCSSIYPWLLMLAISGLGISKNQASFSHVSNIKENCFRCLSSKVSFMTDFFMSKCASNSS